MNPCVRTGIVVTAADTGRTFTGDLFFVGGAWSVRGVPTIGGQAVERRGPIDAVVESMPLTVRPSNGRYSDSCGPLKLLFVADVFREHVKRWYPELVEILP